LKCEKGELALNFLVGSSFDPPQGSTPWLESCKSMIWILNGNDRFRPKSGWFRCHLFNLFSTQKSNKTRFDPPDTTTDSTTSKKIKITKKYFKPKSAAPFAGSILRVKLLVFQSAATSDYDRRLKTVFWNFWNF